MPWAGLDDGWHEDPRFLAVGLAASGLYARASTYIARHLLDGRIPRQALHRLLDDGDATPVSALVREGLLVEAGDHFEVEGYLRANPTRAKVEERRAKKKERAEAGARARWAKESTKKAAAKKEPAPPDREPADEPEHDSMEGL